MNAHATIADPILAELIKAHKAREVYPTGHVMRMTREIDDRSRALSVATCECGVIIRLLATKHLEMDGAIEAHWQKFDHADDRGQPVEDENLSHESGTAGDGVPDQQTAFESEPERSCDPSEASPAPPENESNLAEIEEADDWMLRAAEAMAWQDEPERSANSPINRSGQDDQVVTEIEA